MSKLQKKNKSGVLKVDDIKDICRFCLKLDFYMKPIFVDEEMIKSDYDSDSFAEKYSVSDLNIIELITMVTNLKVYFGFVAYINTAVSIYMCIHINLMHFRLKLMIDFPNKCA